MQSEQANELPRIDFGLDDVPSGKDGLIQVIQERLDREVDRRLEERFIWLVSLMVMFDVFTFREMETWAAPLDRIDPASGTRRPRQGLADGSHMDLDGKAGRQVERRAEMKPRDRKRPGHYPAFQVWRCLDGSFRPFRRIFASRAIPVAKYLVRLCLPAPGPYLTITFAPISTRLYRSIISWFINRMQPDDIALPMDHHSGVPCRR